jgi:Putative beta-barrel porin 2
MQPVAPGIVAGQFTFLPSVTAAAFYDDNVFATNTNRQGSWGALIRPELGVRTAGQNYAIEASGFVEDRWSARFSSEDQLNGAAGVTATVMPDNARGARRFSSEVELRLIGASSLCR